VSSQCLVDTGGLTFQKITGTLSGYSIRRTTHPYPIQYTDTGSQDTRSPTEIPIPICATSHLSKALINRLQDTKIYHQSSRNSKTIRFI
jgi:hypothetical protein